MKLSLDGVEIDMHCLNCGKIIKPFEGDGLATISFDPGTPETRFEPGEPATVYLVCERCTNQFAREGSP